MLGVFIATAIFSSWAYIWFFLVLVVISPGYVEMWEALLTLGFMILLVTVAFACDKQHENKENKEEQAEEEKRKVTKAAIRIMNRKFGMKAMLEVGQGHTPQLSKDVVMSDQDMVNIKAYYTLLLMGKDPKEAEIDELLDCLQADNIVERIMYRKEVSTNHQKAFIRIGRGDKGQA